MAPNNPSQHNIQVDLQVLKDKQFNLLKDLVDKLDTTITKMDKLTKQFTTEATQETEKVYGQGAGRSTARLILPQLMGESGGPYGWPTGPNDGMGDNASTGASPVVGGAAFGQGPPQPPVTGKPRRFDNLDQFAFGRFNPDWEDNPYAQAQFSLGQLGQGAVPTLQYMSYLSGQAGSRQLSRGFGMAATGLIYAQQAPLFDTLQGLLSPSNWQAQAQYGVGVGQSSRGYFGTPVGSEAWKGSIGRQWEAYTRGSWGSTDLGGILPFNIPNPLQDPNYNREQAREAVDLTNQYGWTGVRQDRMLDQLQSYTQRYRGVITQDQMMQIMDPVERFGTGSRAEVDRLFESLGPAAKAAHMNLKVFTEQLLAAAEAMSRATGMTQLGAANALTAFTAATGQSPEVGTGIIGNFTNTLLATQFTGGSLWKATYGDQAGSAQMRGALMKLGPQFGNPEYWQSIKGTPAMDRAKEQLIYLHHANPDLLGGMSPAQFLNSMLRGVNPADAMLAYTRAGKATTKEGMTAMLELGGASNAMPEFENRYAKLLSDYRDSDQTPADRREMIEKQQNMVQNILARRMGRGADKAAADTQKFVITVDERYAHIFKIKPTPKSEDNSKGVFDRVSSGFSDAYGLVKGVTDNPVTSRLLPGGAGMFGDILP